MREITAHKGNKQNETVKVFAQDIDGNGPDGAPWHYMISVAVLGGTNDFHVRFQKEPPTITDPDTGLSREGPNKDITDESLLAVIIDRLAKRAEANPVSAGRANYVTVAKGYLIAAVEALTNKHQLGTIHVNGNSQSGSVSKVNGKKPVTSKKKVTRK